MAFIIPPPPLTENELEKRIRAGARTMSELDPALVQWVLSGPIGLLHRIFKTATYKKLYKPLW